jgi:hypothetical protein
VRQWRALNPPFEAAFARAREDGADAIAANARKVARGETGHSTGDVQRDRLIVETDLKLLAKWDPKRYGDKLQVDADVRMEVTLVDASSGIAEATLVHAAPAMLTKP